MNYFPYDFQIGTLYISAEDEIIIGISPDHYHGTKEDTPIIQACAKQLREYFKGTRKEFTFEYKQTGTPFQEEVWSTLEQIPFGINVYYKDIANMIDNPKASQAVGSACGKNNLLIVVPCHRIVSKSKSGGGFRMGVDIKGELLKLEASYSD